MVNPIRSTLWVLAATLLVAALPSNAQVRVIDSTPVTTAQTQTVTSPSVSAGADLLTRMEQLQQEVLQLRGLVEQQAFEIKRLKQQRLDDYTDLDQRISAILQGGNLTPVSGDPQNASSVNLPNTTPAIPNQTVDPVDQQNIPSERQLYRQAIDLLLKQKDFQGSARLLEQYLEYYPQGLFAPNSQYWLGEIHLSEGDSEQAKTWFSKLLDEYPGHAKIPDAKFKLGKIYFEQGDIVTARELLIDVSQSGTAAAELARNFMAANQL